MRGHVSAETMADFRAGLLPARKAAAISAHLSACPRCAELDAQLAAVTSLLAAAPAPPMPASLVARLDAALAAEAAARAGAAPAAARKDVVPGTTIAREPAAGAPAGPGPIPPSSVPDGPTPHVPTPHGPTAPVPRPHGSRRRAGRAERAGRGPGRGSGTRPPSRLALRIATAAAAIVLVAGGGYTVARVLAGAGSASTPSAAAAPHSVVSHGLASRSAASGLAPLPSANAAAQPPAVRSGTRYQPGLLRAQVRSVLRRFPAGATAVPPAFRANETGSAATFPRLAACVSRVAGAARPRLVDIASYRGRPVAVIVVPVTGSSALRVWLVGTACPAHGGDVIAHFSLAGTG
ncbi:MAG TPA: hypothetical protein VIX86_24200 [Streptosporangiaceae bacterium]